MPSWAKITSRLEVTPASDRRVLVRCRLSCCAPSGIVKIVDMAQLRVLADVDELHLGRVAAGGKVEVTFRGSPSVYRGKISRVAPTVKRMQRIEPDGGSSTDARVVQVEIELDDPSGMPQVLGRETRVTFL